MAAWQALRELVAFGGRKLRLVLVLWQTRVWGGFSPRWGIGEHNACKGYYTRGLLLITRASGVPARPTLCPPPRGLVPGSEPFEFRPAEVGIMVLRMECLGRPSGSAWWAGRFGCRIVEEGGLGHATRGCIPAGHAHLARARARNCAGAVDLC